MSWRKEANMASFVARVWSDALCVVDCWEEVGEICIRGQGVYLNERDLILRLHLFTV